MVAVDYSIAVPALVAWFFLGKTNVDTLRARSSAAGTFVSAQLSSVPGWNSVAEPLLISQVARVFICMHSFVQGLTTDNTNLTEVGVAMHDMHAAIVTEVSPCRSRVPA